MKQPILIALCAFARHAAGQCTAAKDFLAEWREEEQDDGSIKTGYVVKDGRCDHEKPQWEAAKHAVRTAQDIIKLCRDAKPDDKGALDESAVIQAASIAFASIEECHDHNPQPHLLAVHESDPPNEKGKYAKATKDKMMAALDNLDDAILTYCHTAEKAERKAAECVEWDDTDERVA